MTETTPTVLIAVASELAKQAKASLPKLEAGERLQKEWYSNGVYYRETTLNDEIFQASYDFRQRKSCRVEVAK